MKAHSKTPAAEGIEASIADDIERMVERIDDPKLLYRIRGVVVRRKIKREKEIREEELEREWRRLKGVKRGQMLLAREPFEKSSIAFGPGRMRFTRGVRIKQGQRVKVYMVQPRKKIIWIHAKNDEYPDNLYPLRRENLHAFVE